MPGTTLFIRASATADIGAGHAMRMATLAAAWRGASLGRVRWSGEISILFVQRHLESVGVANEGTAALAGDGDVLVVDSYDPEIRAEGGRAAEAGVHVLVDDGQGPVPPGYDLVWWPAPFGNRLVYSRHDCDVLTGPDMVPIRPGLPLWSNDGTDRIGVSLGGGTIPASLLEAVATMGERAGTQRMIGSGSWRPAGWRQSPADQFWTALSHCGRLLVAGGISALEAAAVGIPVVVIAFADNQQPTLQWARASGVPTIDVARYRDALELAHALELALPQAKPLPPLADGSARVARHLAELARRLVA
jgi:spore coat polysaccharide biosynthesis predicted glycosyltransferase SpsG